MLKDMQLQGRLLISALTLLILSVPAALIYIYYDLNGKETLKLLSALFYFSGCHLLFCILFILHPACPGDNIAALRRGRCTMVPDQKRQSKDYRNHNFSSGSFNSDQKIYGI